MCFCFSKNAFSTFTSSVGQRSLFGDRRSSAFFVAQLRLRHFLFLGGNKMKKKAITLFLATLMAFSFSACNGQIRNSNTTTQNSTIPETSVPTTSNSSSSKNSSKSFTNAYGTPTTTCVHSGCNNYIASSGDTNCCTKHSNRCLDCNKYIDGDAMYCVSCIRKAFNQLLDKK